MVQAGRVVDSMGPCKVKRSALQSSPSSRFSLSTHGICALCLFASIRGGPARPLRAAKSQRTHDDKGIRFSLRYRVSSTKGREAM